MSESENPQVSVVLPVYNSEQYLGETIESILTQTFHDFELVIVDDESTDSTPQILGRIARSDHRVTVLSRHRTGIVGARNDGMNVARGEFIACMDHDDVMMPDRLQRQVDYLGKHPKCVAVGGFGLLIDPDGDPLIERRLPIDHQDIEEELFRGINPLIQPSVTIRRESIIAIGGYREESNFAEDYDLFLRLSDLGQLVNLPHVLVKYRQHMSRASHAHYENQNEVAAAALQEAFQRRGRDDFVKPQPQNWHPNTAAGFHIRCVNDALDGGNVQTARKHAWALFRQSPCSPRAWDLMLRVYLGRQGNRRLQAVKSMFRPLKKARSSDEKLS